MKMSKTQKEITIFVDGGVQNNGQRDCYGACAYLILMDGLYLNENTECIYDTTNNRAEMQAILNALYYIKDNRLHTHNITIHSDSQYCVNGCTAWMYSWVKKKFMRDGFNIPNSDLWQEMYRLVSNFPNLKFNWVKGHEDNEWNNYVNDLCSLRQEVMKNDLN